MSSLHAFVVPLRESINFATQQAYEASSMEFRESWRNCLSNDRAHEGGTPSRQCCAPVKISWDCLEKRTLQRAQ